MKRDTEDITFKWSKKNYAFKRNSKAKIKDKGTKKIYSLQ